MKNTAIIIFILTYLLLLILPKIRAYIALSSALSFIVLGILSIEKALIAIDWNVILMITGTMGIVFLFIESKMPALLADLILEKTPNVKWAILALSLFAGLISAFIDNVATVLMVAPVALDICKKLKISPVTSIIAIAISSNLQGAATLVGDTTSILLSGYANLDFLDFFFFRNRLGIFWVVQAGALTSTLVLIYILEKNIQPINSLDRTPVEDFFPSILLLGMVVLLIIASFIPNTPKTINGLICISLFLLGLVKEYYKRKNLTYIAKALKSIDYFTVLLLIGLFIVVGGLVEVGIVDDISKLFIRFGHNDIFVIYSLLLWASVFFSAFIDNIPYVATMLPVVTSIASILNVEPYILYFGLLSGATLGGNLTPIGASANITALGILRREGYEVKASEFMKIGVPFTLAAVITAYLILWLAWS